MDLNLSQRVGLNSDDDGAASISNGYTDLFSLVSNGPALTAVICISVLSLLIYALPASHDSREPPVLKSRIPLIGHLISMLVHRAKFLKVTYDKTGQLSLASLPILNGKLYVVWDASLIQSVFNNRHLEFTPFIIEFAQREVGYGKDVDKVLRETTLMNDMFAAIRDAMTLKNTNRMSANALDYISMRLEAVGSNTKWVEVPNVYLWVRNVMTLATTNAMYGPEDPLQRDPALCDDLWLFERDLPLFLFKLFPYVFANPAWKARERIKEALGKYYAAEHDAGDLVAPIVHKRATQIRKHGIINEEAGHLELTLLHVATSNTIPTIFWMLAYVFTDPDLASRLREEVIRCVQLDDNDNAIFDVDDLPETCPLLVSAYRETIRMCNKTIGNRRATADTTIPDGNGGSYLLKKGTNIQTSAEVLHNLESVWGSDTAVFNAERFVASGSKPQASSTAATKARRLSYMPFGGGKHLCPGRNFAFTENLGFIMTLLCAYEVEPPRGMRQPGGGGSGSGPWKVPEQAECSIAAAVCKPARNGEGFGMRIRRREGWSRRTFHYRVGGNVAKRRL